MRPLTLTTPKPLSSSQAITVSYSLERLRAAGFRNWSSTTLAGHQIEGAGKRRRYGVVHEYSRESNP